MNHTTAGAYQRVTAALAANGSQRKGWDWNCPVHPDRTQSLTVKQAPGKALVCCHAGCETATVVKALGLDMRDLYDQAHAGHPSTVRREIRALREHAPA